MSKKHTHGGKATAEVTLPSELAAIEFAPPTEVTIIPPEAPAVAPPLAIKVAVAKVQRELSAEFEAIEKLADSNVDTGEKLQLGLREIRARIMAFAHTVVVTVRANNSQAGDFTLPTAPPGALSDTVWNDRETAFRAVFTTGIAHKSSIRDVMVLLYNDSANPGVEQNYKTLRTSEKGNRPGEDPSLTYDRETIVKIGGEVPDSVWRAMIALANATDATAETAAETMRKVGPVAVTRLKSHLSGTDGSQSIEAKTLNKALDLFKARDEDGELVTRIPAETFLSAIPEPQGSDKKDSGWSLVFQFIEKPEKPEKTVIRLLPYSTAEKDSWMTEFSDEELTDLAAKCRAEAKDADAILAARARPQAEKDALERARLDALAAEERQKETAEAKKNELLARYAAGGEDAKLAYALLRDYYHMTLEPVTQ